MILSSSLPRTCRHVALLLACLAAHGLAQAPAPDAAPASEIEPDAVSSLTPEQRQALIERHKAKSPIAAVPREEIRAALEKYFGTPKDLKRPDPTPEILEKLDDPKFERWHLRYRVEEDEFSYAYLFLPKPLPSSAHPRPLVMCPHPTADLGKNRICGVYTDEPADEKEAAARITRQYAADIAHRGFIVFAPDRAGYGERRLLPEGNYLAQMSAFRKHLGQRHPGWKLTSGKNVWDLQRGLDMLETFDFIDRENIATIGHSLGAWDSIMLLAMDDRVKVGVVNSGGLPAFRPELWEDPVALRAYLANEKAQGLSLNANLMIMLAAPRPLMYLHSMQDAYERGLPNLIEGLRSFTKYYRTISHQQTLPTKADFNLIFHGYGHMFPLEAREAAYKFLEMRLHLEK